jgi:[acyl-carrier-protein] S-malonyltransferase
MMLLCDEHHIKKGVSIMKIAFLFPGYGSQFVGMSKELYDESRVIQEYFEEASNCLDTNFVKLCFAASDAEISKIDKAYTSIFLVSSALCGLLKSEGIMPDVVAGYNTGEYAAFHAVGGINFPDGLYLLNKYASLYDQALTTMSVSCLEVHGMSTDKLETICKQVRAMKQFVAIAVYGTPFNHIIAGDSAAVQLVHNAVVQQEAEVVEISPAVGLHSELMEEVVTQFKPYLEKVDFKDMVIPCLSGHDNQYIAQGSEIKDCIIHTIDMPIAWTDTMETLQAYDILIEVGPSNRLSTIAQYMYPEKAIVAINNRADIDALQAMLKQ